VCPKFAKGNGVAFFPASLEEVGDALKKEQVIVVVRGRRKTRFVVVEADLM
jgi:hypothetical protein